MTARCFLLGVSFIGLAGCSASSGSRLFGSGGTTGGGGDTTITSGARAAVVVGAGAPSARGPNFVVTDASTTWPLSAHIERDHVTVSLITVACGGGCADIVAVATGGYPPYTFTWEDGTTGAARHVCPGVDSMYVVDVTDTGNGSGEIRRNAQTTRAFLDAQVMRCPPRRSSNASAPRRAVRRQSILRGLGADHRVRRIQRAALGDLRSTRQPRRPQRFRRMDRTGTGSYRWLDIPGDAVSLPGLARNRGRTAVRADDRRKAIQLRARPLVPRSDRRLHAGTSRSVGQPGLVRRRPVAVDFTGSAAHLADVLRDVHRAASIHLPAAQAGRHRWRRSRRSHRARRPVLALGRSGTGMARG